MFWKRAAGMAALVYLASLLLGFASSRIFRLEGDAALHPSLGPWLFSLLGTTIIVAGFTWWYFYNRDANAKEGFFLGLVMIGVSFFLDGLLLIPSFLLGNTPGYLFAYYATPIFWVSVAIILVISPLTAILRKKQQDMIRQKAGYGKA